MLEELTVKRGNPSACERGMQQPDSSSAASRAKNLLQNPQGRERAKSIVHKFFSPRPGFGPDRPRKAPLDLSRLVLRTTTSHIQLRGEIRQIATCGDRQQPEGTLFVG